MKEERSTDLTPGSRGNPLWTRDFTIITLGSVVSMLGNSMSGFAMSLMVLDISQSTLLYAIYIIMFTAPSLIMPMFAGALLDRFSRKKTIYMLDFITAGIYAAFALLLSRGWFSFPLFAAGCFVIGSIESIYFVAYESLYPLTITEGNYQKAYSIASVLETLTAVMVPVATFLYKRIGLAPLVGINAACFFIAACLETRIGVKEEYIDRQKEQADENVKGFRRMTADVKEGLRYLLTEKGLLAVALYFTVSSFTGGASSVITLPYFKAAFPNGEYRYMLVWGMAIVGRMIGGSIHYRTKIPEKRRYAVALTVYIVISVLEGVYLFLPLALMMVCTFLNGFGGVTSYTIRISATQSYVPDEKKGRFNGAFNMLNTVGVLAGEFLAGALTVVMPERWVLFTFMMICAVSAVIFIGGNAKHVAAIYNRQV